MKTVTAQSVKPITTITFNVKAGVIVGLTSDVEINYGTFGRNETVELWNKLSKDQRSALQGIYDTLNTQTENAILL